MNVHVPFTQAGRTIGIETALGPDVLLLERLTIDEGVNALFLIEAAVRSQRDDLKAGDLIGSSVDFRLKLADGGTRWWNGFVTALHEGSLLTRGTRSYALTVRPKLWTLSQTSNCRIFRQTNSVQVVETLCQEHGISDIDIRVTGQPPSLDYSVQWNETDLDYLLRRTQQDGLFLFFTQAQGKHTLVVADHASGYDDSTPSAVRFSEGSTDGDHIVAWRRSFAFTPGKRTARDWNFLTMSAPQDTETTLDPVPGNDAAELYEYRGLFADTSGAEAAMKARIQTSEAGYETVEARSFVRTLAPGQRFTPYDKAKPDDLFAAQVVLSIRHEAEDRSYETNSGQPSASHPVYANTFTALPASTPATPRRTVKRPLVTGSQIALIAGPAGEEIFCDQWGRVKVWFPWDRRAVKDGSDTCWIRVGQPWVGTTWGHQVIPRVGMEAVLSFEEGDPDRPFVLAVLPDPTNPVPYPLPDNKTRMVMRSNSYKSQGFNEMTFEDATGAENMFFHAQKDHTTKIENNQTNSVGANQSQVIGQNQALTVGANQTQEVGGSLNLTVGGTGGGAASLMGPLAGLAGQTASLLGQAFQAGGASGGGAGGASALTTALSGIAGMAMGMAGSAGSGGSGGAGSLLGMAMGAAGAAGGGVGGIMGTMAPQLASSLIGILGGAGQQAQGQVGDGPSPRPDAGTALAAAGAQFAQGAQGLFSQGGMMNTIVGTMRTDSTGVAHVEQVGVSKVSNVGKTSLENVGLGKMTLVGKEYQEKTGIYRLIQSDKDIDIHSRNVLQLSSDKTILVSDSKILLSTPGGMIELNDSGIVISGKKIHIITNSLDIDPGLKNEECMKTSRGIVFGE